MIPIYNLAGVHVHNCYTYMDADVYITEHPGTFYYI